MPNVDWRSPETYSRVERADMAGLAWEYLRRNPAYRQQFRALVNPLDGPPSEFRQKWGLTFRS